MRNLKRMRGKRPISFQHSMHVILRSTLAKGVWSFVRPANRHMIIRVLNKHMYRTGVMIYGVGNAGNHLHIRIKVQSRKQYAKFIRAVTGEIALHIKKIANSAALHKKRLWDKRPFTSIVGNAQYLSRIKDYIRINHLEGTGYSRAFARLIVERWKTDKNFVLKSNTC